MSANYFLHWPLSGLSIRFEHGHKEPIITTLPEPLNSGTSIITTKHPYLEINIPPNGESDTKVLPIGEVSIIQTINPHNPPPNPEGSIAAEVNHLLDQAMAEASSHKSEQSSLEKITQAAVTTRLHLRSQKLQFHQLILHPKPAWRRQKAP